MVKVIAVGKNLSTKEVSARATKCSSERICFVSLKSLDGVEAVAINHGVAGSVQVHPKYA